MTESVPNSAEGQPQNTASLSTSDKPQTVLNRVLNSKSVPVVFTGKKMEYFKLWLVNLLLSIITLGIYSAWAKVRNTQYLYGHTQVDGHRFSFLAKPIQILIGRMLAVVVFAIYTMISGLNPILGLICGLLLVAAYPWLINSGLRFSMRNTSYRNVRFSFNGTYGGAFITFMLLPILGVLSLWLAMPWVLKKIHDYIYENISYGGKSVQLSTSTGYYYKASLITLGISAVIFGGGYLVVEATDLLYKLQYGYISIAAVMPLILAFYLVALSLIAGVFYALMFNHLGNAMKIDDVASLKTNLSVQSYCWLNLSNSLLLIVTLGLAFPVTLIRKNRLLASATEVTLQPDLERLVNTEQTDERAFGEEAAGVFDVDLSLT
ncbi:YjgN family protein [Oceanospirillum sp. HFRX-1_2]